MIETLSLAAVWPLTFSSHLADFTSLNILLFSSLWHGGLTSSSSSRLESPLSTITHVWMVELDFAETDLDSPHHTFCLAMPHLQGLWTHLLSLANMLAAQWINLDMETTGFTSLKMLTIKHVRFTDIYHILNTISKFRSMEHLNLCGINFNCYILVDDCHPVARKSAKPSWRVLELHYPEHAYKVLTLLPIQVDISALQTVVLTGLDLRDIASAGIFLRILGPQLKHLELQLTSLPMLSKSRCYPEYRILIFSPLTFYFRTHWEPSWLIPRQQYTIHSHHTARFHQHS